MLRAGRRDTREPPKSKGPHQGYQGGAQVLSAIKDLDE